MYGAAMVKQSLWQREGQRCGKLRACHLVYILHSLRRGVRTGVHMHKLYRRRAKPGGPLGRRYYSEHLSCGEQNDETLTGMD